MDESIKILKTFSANMKKALTGAVASSITKRTVLSQTAANTYQDSGNLEVIHTIDTSNRNGEWDQLIIAAEVLDAPSVHSLNVQKGSDSSCGSCGYVFKSIKPGCPRCAQAHVTESKPIWNR